MSPQVDKSINFENMKAAEGGSNKKSTHAFFVHNNKEMNQPFKYPRVLKQYNRYDKKMESSTNGIATIQLINKSNSNEDLVSKSEKSQSPQNKS